MEINFETQILRKLDRDGLSYMVGCTILEQVYLLRQTYFFPFRPPLKIGKELCGTKTSCELVGETYKKGNNPGEGTCK